MTTQLSIQVKYLILFVTILSTILNAQNLDKITHEERVALHNQRMLNFPDLTNMLSSPDAIIMNRDEEGNVISFTFSEEVPENVQNYFNQNIHKFSKNYWVEQFDDPDFRRSMKIPADSVSILEIIDSFNTP